MLKWEWNCNKKDLTLADELSEFMFLGLRMMTGINKRYFENRFGMDIYTVFGDDIKELAKMDLLEDAETNIKLTARGIDISNQVFVKFLK